MKKQNNDAEKYARMLDHFIIDPLGAQHFYAEGLYNSVTMLEGYAAELEKEAGHQATLDRMEFSIALVILAEMLRIRARSKAADDLLKTISTEEKQNDENIIK